MKVRIYLLENGKKFMGVGVFWLLKEIAKQGSLRKAAISLDLSYTKAFRMICDLEKALGMKILERRRGGQAREGALLTVFAQNFVLLYEKLQTRTYDYASKEFQLFSKELGQLKNRCGALAPEGGTNEKF